MYRVQTKILYVHYTLYMVSFKSKRTIGINYLISKIGNALSRLHLNYYYLYYLDQQQVSKKLLDRKVIDSYIANVL